ncbi:MAG: DUF4974 domain-containing protein [Bacteroidales bacterium]|nr:DUF4974 domain-containing protein [Bacteroidales bacterium]
MMSENWDIIAKYLANEELNDEELQIVENLKNDAEGQQLLRESAGVFDDTSLYLQQKQYNTLNAWQKVNASVARSARRRLFVISSRVAAAVVILVVSAFALWQLGSNHNSLTEFSTAMNDVSKPVLVLPDGTNVTVNRNSKISYPEKFTGNTREVTLSGEAFFQVTPNPDKPFIIHANGASVKVLGTSFNVYAYGNEPIVEVLVKTGKVELLGKNAGTVSSSVLLMPGEKGVFVKAKGEMAKQQEPNFNNFSWLTNEIEFDNTPLPEVVATINRAFPVTVETAAGVDANLHLTATFNQQKPEYILDVLALTLNLRLEKAQDNHYIISKID